MIQKLIGSANRIAFRNFLSANTDGTYVCTTNHSPNRQFDYSFLLIFLFLLRYYSLLTYLKRGATWKSVSFNKAVCVRRNGINSTKTDVNRDGYVKVILLCITVFLTHICSLYLFCHNPSCQTDSYFRTFHSAYTFIRKETTSFLGYGDKT